MAATALQFPSKADLVSYLGQHPKTSSEDKRIIDAVAGAFANKTKALVGVKMGLNLALFKANDGLTAKEQLHLSDRALTAINQNFTEALVACAQGKSLEEKKDGR